MENETGEETQAPETNESEKTENQEESIEDSSKDVDELRKKVETLEKQKNHWRKKAETPKEESPVEEIPKEETNNLSGKDFLALTEAKVTSDDFDEVMGWSKYKNISVAEAMKDKTLQTILKERSEERTTAEATQTQKTGRKNVPSSPESIISKASQDNLPESDEGIAELVNAEIAMKKKKLH